ncbi:hypothetical protein CABS01_06267 [Colletotrichum abscissum]|nr:uncharacterized protein CABS01_06267 [Colletotrichum abscissum]KAK1516300.1 hypothetical protein CABS01_06267 [Colletotrichum abscissum]
MANIQKYTERSNVQSNPTDWIAKLPDPKTHIRLLTILSGRQTEELRCTCSTIRLDDRPKYNALSYVWGNREAKAQVIVNGVQVTINKSLAGALRRIRHDREPIVIWADALCINQNDEDEKKYQIDLMHRIYGECENCLVWMGDIVVKGDSSVAAELAARAALNALRIIARQPHDEDLGWPGQNPIATSVAGNGLTAGAALQSMMDCEWWQRIWTVQEVCLPPKATVLWGPLEISFQAIMDAASHMVQPDEHPQRNNIFDLFQEGTAMYPRLHTSPYTIPVLSIAHARLWNQSRTDSLYRLWRFRDRRSTYPKDKLFGIWALLNKTYLPDIRPTDYVLDIVVLFSRLMVSLLRSLDSLKPLIGWRGERETAGLPTWVLDLAQPEDSNCTSDFWTHDIAWRQFHASSGLPRFKPPVKQAEDLTLLTLDGIRVDKVATILMDLRHTRRSLWRQGFEDAIKDQAGKDDIMYQYNNLIQGKFGENRERVTDESWHGGPWWEDRMLCYQVLFITQENRLGLGPPNLKPEDNVWILSGGNHPFLLRQVSKRRGNADLWEFVGDCFVYGIIESWNEHVVNQTGDGIILRLYGLIQNILTTLVPSSVLTSTIMASSKRWPAPIHVFSYRALLVVPIILAIATFAALFIHSDVNVALLYSQCDARARLPAVSKVPVLGPPVCFAISFFQSALDSMRTFASMSAILSFIAGLMTVTTIEAARVCNAPNVVIANPTGPWLVFNLIGGAVVWQLVILPAFFHRSRSILLARKRAGQEAVESAASKDPDFGKDSRHLVVDAEIIAIPVSVAWGFILPSLLMLIYNSPVIIVVWLFFPVWVSLIRQAVRWAVLRVQKRQHRSFHLESHTVSLLLVYLIPILCSAVSHVYFIWSLFQWDDRKEMTRATVKFVEIDMFFIGLTVLYWLFVETGWKVPLVAVLGAIPLGPGAGICIAWIYRDTEIRESLKQWLSDVVGSQEEANEEGRASASEETPLLH